MHAQTDYEIKYRTTTDSLPPAKFDGLVYVPAVPSARNMKRYEQQNPGMKQALVGDQYNAV